MTVSNCEYVIDCKDVAEAGDRTISLKKQLIEYGVSKELIRRISVASYEAEVNIIIHSYGGTMCYNIKDNYLEVIFKDIGPGIPNVDDALMKGYSTANQYARENGFGAGMGLPNIKDASDYFNLESSDTGTILTIGFNLEIQNG